MGIKILMMIQEIQQNILKTKLQELLIYSNQINEIIEKQQEELMGEKNEQN